MSVDMLSIQPGSEVLMHFTLRLEDGTVAEATQRDEPLRFTLGDGTLVEGLELALMGLKPGDVQRLTIPPEHAYGFPDPANIRPIDRAEFPDDVVLQRGLIIAFTLPDEEEIPGTILDVDDHRVTVDFNHPLAGHEVDFEVEVLEVSGNRAPPTLQ